MNYKGPKASCSKRQMEAKDILICEQRRGRTLLSPRASRGPTAPQRQLTAHFTRRMAAAR